MIAKLVFKTIRCPLGIFTLVWNGLFLLHNLPLVEYVNITIVSGTIIVLSYLFFLFGSSFAYIIYPKQSFLNNKKKVYLQPINNELELYKTTNIANINIKSAKRGVDIAIVFSNLGIILWLIQVIKLVSLSSFTALNMYLARALIRGNISALTGYLINIFSIGGSVLAGILVARGYQFKKRYTLLFLPTFVVASFTGQRFMTIICFLTFLSPLLTLGTGQLLKKIDRKKFKTVFLGAMILVLFFVYIGDKRGSFDEFSTTGILTSPVLARTYTYITGSFAAFSEQLNAWDGSLMFGANTFFPFFKLTNNLGIISYSSSELDMIDNVHHFVYIPGAFNVYSYLMDVVNDWGYLGVMVFPFLLGFISSHYWEKCNSSRSVSYREIMLSFTVLYLMFSFIASVTSFSTVWYAYIYALISLKLFEKKIRF
jgi:oligosaccharide repeat unit polymerase